MEEAACFFGTLGREEAERFLRSAGPQSLLVRKSSNSNSFVVSLLLSDDEFCHAPMKETEHADGHKVYYTQGDEHVEGMIADSILEAVLRSASYRGLRLVDNKIMRCDGFEDQTVKEGGGERTQNDQPTECPAETQQEAEGEANFSADAAKLPTTQGPNNPSQAPLPAKRGLGLAGPLPMRRASMLTTPAAGTGGPAFVLAAKSQSVVSRRPSPPPVLRAGIASVPVFPNTLQQQQPGRKPFSNVVQIPAFSAAASLPSTQAPGAGESVSSAPAMSSTAASLAAAAPSTAVAAVPEPENAATAACAIVSAAKAGEKSICGHFTRPAEATTSGGQAFQKMLPANREVAPLHAPPAGQGTLHAQSEAQGMLHAPPAGQGTLHAPPAGQGALHARSRISLPPAGQGELDKPKPTAVALHRTDTPPKAGHGVLRRPTPFPLQLQQIANDVHPGSQLLSANASTLPAPQGESPIYGHFHPVTMLPRDATPPPAEQPSSGNFQTDPVDDGGGQAALLHQAREQGFGNDVYASLSRDELSATALDDSARQQNSVSNEMNFLSTGEQIDGANSSAESEETAPKPAGASPYITAGSQVDSIDATPASGQMQDDTYGKIVSIETVQRDYAALLEHFQAAKQEIVALKRQLGERDQQVAQLTQLAELAKQNQLAGQPVQQPLLQQQQQQQQPTVSIETFADSKPKDRKSRSISFRRFTHKNG